MKMQKSKLPPKASKKIAQKNTVQNQQQQKEFIQEILQDIKTKNESKIEVCFENEPRTIVPQPFSIKIEELEQLQLLINNAKNQIVQRTPANMISSESVPQTPPYDPNIDFTGLQQNFQIRAKSTEQATHLHYPSISSSPYIKQDTPSPQLPQSNSLTQDRSASPCHTNISQLKQYKRMMKTNLQSKIMLKRLAKAQNEQQFQLLELEEQIFALQKENKSLKSEVNALKSSKKVAAMGLDDMREQMKQVQEQLLYFSAELKIVSEKASFLQMGSPSSSIAYSKARSPTKRSIMEYGNSIIENSIFK